MTDNDKKDARMPGYVHVGATQDQSAAAGAARQGGNTSEDVKVRFEAWATKDGSYDLRPAKWKTISVRGEPYDGYVRPYLQDRTVYTYQGFCAGLDAATPAATSGDAPADLQKLKVLALAATPGPWAYQEDSDAYTHIVRPVASPGWIIASATQTSKPEGEANGRWIAAANPVVVLDLIARIEHEREVAASWQRTAEKKDRDWNEARMAFENYKCAERAAAPATASGDELPELPAPLEIVWPELHRQGLGCGVEDRNITDRYDAAEYGWECGVERAIECVPELLYEEATVLEIQRAAYELGKARAAVSAATKPTADLPEPAASIWYHRGLPNFDDTDKLKALDDGTGKAIPLYTAEQVQSLLATKPAVPEDEQEAIGTISRNRDDESLIFTPLCDFYVTDGMKVYAAPAASTTGAAQTAEQVRDQALEHAAMLCDLKFKTRAQSGHPREASAARSLAEEIRALKRPTPTHSSEAGE